MRLINIINYYRARMPTAYSRRYCRWTLFVDGDGDSSVGGCSPRIKVFVFVYATLCLCVWVHFPQFASIAQCTISIYLAPESLIQKQRVPHSRTLLWKPKAASAIVDHHASCQNALDKDEEKIDWCRDGDKLSRNRFRFNGRARGRA